MSRPVRGRPICVTVVVALALGLAVSVPLGLVHLGETASSLSFLAPAGLAVALIWVGRYPGERVLLALARTRRASRGSRITRPRTPVGSRAAPRVRLLGSCIAGRAPPPRA